MLEIEFLTERDIDYFRKKEQAGEPVHVIDIDPETLDKINLDYISNPVEKKGQIPNEEEIKDWVEKHPMLMEKRKEADERAAKDPVTGIKEGIYSKETVEAEKRPEVIEARKREEEKVKAWKQKIKDIYEYENLSEDDKNILEMACIYLAKHHATDRQFDRILDARGMQERITAYAEVQEQIRINEREQERQKRDS